jgi:hypothetical protein
MELSLIEPKDDHWYTDKVIATQRGCYKMQLLVC